MLLVRTITKAFYKMLLKIRKCIKSDCEDQSDKKNILHISSFMFQLHVFSYFIIVSKKK